MEKSLDYKGRKWRNHTVTFVSDEEANSVEDDLVALSGLTKQDSSQDGSCAGTVFVCRAIRGV